MKSEKVYKINNTYFALREKYSLRDWGNILKIIGDLDPENNKNSFIILLSEGKIIDLLNIILNGKVPEEIYEEDFAEVTRAINDFFLRKQSLIKNIS
ncbi:MAG: hypothetical protein NZM09_12115 [Ignavibacterium sp.]|nr:hypothetical protein [Ignavibacterium sp.]MDW8376420.1 hypothetical protein [Ignavibacteriales bacterium]